MSIAEETRQVRTTSLGWMIQRLSRRIEDAMTARLAEHGLTLSAFAVMMTVLEHGPMTQAEIGRHFAMPAYGISRALDLLEGRGLVARGPHATSRRAHRVAATPEGLALAPRLQAIVREVNEAFAAPLTEAERAGFAAVLAKLMASDGLREDGAAG